MPEEDPAPSARTNRTFLAVLVVVALVPFSIMLTVFSRRMERESPEAEELHQLLAQLPGSGLVWDHNKRRLEWARAEWMGGDDGK